MTWIDVYKNKNKHVVKEQGTGRIKVVEYDQKYRESLKRGDMLQPFGKDKKEFFQRNPDFYENKNGQIVSKSHENEVSKSNEEYRERLEREKFNNKDKIHKKFY